MSKDVRNGLLFLLVAVVLILGWAYDKAEEARKDREWRIQSKAAQAVALRIYQHQIAIEKLQQKGK